MSGRESSQGGGAKGQETPSRGVGRGRGAVRGRGRGSGRSPFSPRPAPAVRPPLFPVVSTTSTTGKSGAPKRTCRSIFRRADDPGQGTSASRTVQDAGETGGSGGSGVGPGDAGLHTPPPVAAAGAAQPPPESPGDRSSGLGAGEGSPDFSSVFTPRTKRMLEGLGPSPSSPAGSSPVPQAPGSPSGSRESEMPEEEEEEQMQVEELPSTSSAPLPPPRASSTPSQPSRSGSSGGRAPASGLPVGAKSAVWKHFQICEEDVRKAQCQICKVKVSRGQNLKRLSTSGLQLHLERHHSLMLSQETRAASGKVSASGTPSAGGPREGRPRPSPSKGAEPTPPAARHQRTLTEMVGGVRLSRAQAKKEGKIISRQIAAMIAECELPYSVVEKASFRALVHKSWPWYTIPSRSHMARKVVPALYRATRDRVEESLSRARGTGVHFTSDLWTCPHSQHAYLSLTAHWWDPSELDQGESREEQGLCPRKPGYRRALLGAEVLAASHTGQNISDAIQRQLAEWHVDRASTAGFLVTDGGSNMKSAAALLRMQRIPCAAHLLNLVVKDALGDLSNVESADSRDFRHVLLKCRAIVSHFHRSPRDTQALREEQVTAGVHEHRLIGDVSTRWNSTHDMLARLVEQRSALDAFFASNRAFPEEHQLDDHEWSIVAQAVEVLEPFKSLTVALSGDDATLVLVVLVYRHALRVLASYEEEPERVVGLGPAVRGLVRRLRNGMESRFGEIIRSEPYMVASMCDPKLKGVLAEEFGLLDSSREALCRLVKELQERRGTVPGAGRVGQERSTAPASDRPATQGSVPPPSSIVMALYGEAKSSGRRLGPETGSAEAVVRDYLAESDEPVTSDPLTYWATKQRIWPELSLVARRYLSCPPTSVASERIFSVAGDIASPHRSRLQPWRVEELTFLKVNCPLFGYPVADVSEDE